MTTTQQLDFIRGKCIEANPSIKSLPEYPYNPDAAKAIVELEKVLGKTFWNKDIENIATFHIENYRQQQASDYRAMLDGRYEGRKIGLADVLCTLQHQYHLYKPDKWYNLIFPLVTWHYETAWYLVKDDLTAQSPETISFIATLLGYKE